jgi:hypothetical protein
MAEHDVTPHSRRAIRKPLLFSLGLIAVLVGAAIWIFWEDVVVLISGEPKVGFCIRRDAGTPNFVLVRRFDRRAWDISLPNAKESASMTLDCEIAERSMEHEIMSSVHAFCLGRRPFGSSCRIVRLSVPGWIPGLERHYDLGTIDWVPGSEGQGVLTTSGLAGKKIKAGQWFRLGGIVSEGSVNSRAEPRPSFVITDKRTDLVVHSEIVLPDFVKDYACVLLEGTVGRNRALFAHEMHRVYKMDALSLPVDKQPCEWAK